MLWAFIKGISIAIWMVLLTLALLAALIIGGWKAHWWFASHNATNQTKVIQQGYGYQQSLVDDINNKMSTVYNIGTEITQAEQQHESIGGLAEQQHAVLNQVCADAALLDSPLPDQHEQQTINNDCVDGHAK